MAGGRDAPQGPVLFDFAQGKVMPNPEWGKKRVCPTTGTRFYDMNANPIISPYTGQIVTFDTAKSRTMVADAEDMQTKKLKVLDPEDELLLDDEDTGDNDVDLDDEVLEDDGEDEVSFDELGDVAADDE
jgi:uncharacterized protein (TIGR02300 family)